MKYEMEMVYLPRYFIWNFAKTLQIRSENFRSKAKKTKDFEKKSNFFVSLETLCYVQNKERCEQLWHRWQHKQCPYK